MKFQHEVSILILWGWWWSVSVLSAWYFSILPTAFYSWYFCILCHNLSQWTCTFSKQQACSIHIFALSTWNQGQFLPIKISGDVDVTTSCCLTVRISNLVAYILQMAGAMRWPAYTQAISAKQEKWFSSIDKGYLPFFVVADAKLSNTLWITWKLFDSYSQLLLPETYSCCCQLYSISMKD